MLKLWGRHFETAEPLTLTESEKIAAGLFTPVTFGQPQRKPPRKPRESGKPRVVRTPEALFERHGGVKLAQVAALYRRKATVKQIRVLCSMSRRDVEAHIVNLGIKRDQVGRGCTLDMALAVRLIKKSESADVAAVALGCSPDHFRRVRRRYEKREALGQT